MYFFFLMTQAEASHTRTSDTCTDRGVPILNRFGIHLRAAARNTDATHAMLTFVDGVFYLNTLHAIR